MLVPVAGSSLFTAVGAASAQFAAMTGKRYVFTCNTNCFIKQAPSASNPVASAAAGSMYVPSGVQVFIDPKYGDTVAVIQDTVAGKATLQELAEVG